MHDITGPGQNMPFELFGRTWEENVLVSET